MPYNTKQLVRDQATSPVPQYFNVTADAYEAAQGANGKQFVQASELEALLGALNGAAVTDPAASAAVIQLLKGLIKQLQGTGSGSQPVNLSSMLPAGTNNIGDVDVLSLPMLPAGTNNIGDVDVLSLPSLPAGNNNIGDVDIASMPSLPAGANNIGDVDIATVPKVGAHGNAWNGAVAAGGTSASVNCADTSVITVFGNSNIATEITVQHSQNNAAFYDSSLKITLSAPGDFVLTFDSAAAFHRLKSSVAGTITATIAGKA